MLIADGDTSKVDRWMKSNCLLGSLLLIKGVINSALAIHVLNPNGIYLTDVFDNFTCMQLIELVCVIFMKHEGYAAFRILCHSTDPT